jgi:ABC-type lipoprotein release transport system permease subunit
MRRRGIEPGGKLPLRDASGESRTLTLSTPAESRGAQGSAALIQVSEGTFRALTGMPEGFATDLVLRVRNPRELSTIARKIVRSHPAARPVVRDELVRTYASVYHWRAGVIIALLLVPVLAFVLFAWDKAAGLSPEERREIGILKAIGWETGEVLLLKCYEGMVVSVAAFAMGTLLAALAGALARLPAVSALTGWSALYPAVPTPLTVGPFQVATLCFLTVVPYLVATVIPAWRAATIDPDLVMRG